MSTHHFKVLSDIVHFLAFEVGYDDEYLVASGIVHPA
jgi:hypothetical protein